MILTACHHASHQFQELTASWTKHTSSSTAQGRLRRPKAEVLLCWSRSGKAGSRAQAMVQAMLLKATLCDHST